MTIQEAKSKLVNWVNSQVGYHEGLDNYNKYGADGDWDEKLYGFDASHAYWCDVLVDYAFIHVFGYDLGTKMTFQYPNGYALCRWSADAYKENGHWFTEPEVGDQIFFIYGGDINHTGIVVSVNGDQISCVEGNYSDAVSKTYYNWRISNQIAGFGRPNWALVTMDEPSAPEDSPSDSTPSEPEEDKQHPGNERAYHTLHVGDGINAPRADVKAWQNLLLCWNIDIGYAGADGEFGNDTKVATEQFQHKLGLNVTGIVDEECWKQAIYIG